MLPLWIIDIRTNSSRRQSFLELLQQVEYVRIPDEFKFASVETDALDSSSTDQDSIAASFSNKQENVEIKSDKSAEELRKEEERRLAQKESIIKGNYWYYSAFDDPFRDIDLDNHPLENLYDENGELTQVGIAQPSVRVLLLAHRTTRFH